MENFVNKIKTKDDAIYDIHDERLDAIESGTIKESLGLDSQGKLVKGSASSGSEIFEISGSFIAPEITIEITQEQYQKLLGDNVVLKVNDSENGSLYLYKTNGTTEPNMAVYNNILTNISFSAVVQQVETEGEPEYAVVITSQTLGGGTDLPFVIIDKEVSYDSTGCTVQDIIDALGESYDAEHGGSYSIYFTLGGSGVLSSGLATFTAQYQGPNLIFFIYQVDQTASVEYSYLSSTDNLASSRNSSIRKIFVPQPDSSGTYTLKSINGTLTWVQDV